MNGSESLEVKHSEELEYKEDKAGELFEADAG